MPNPSELARIDEELTLADGHATSENPVATRHDDHPMGGTKPLEPLTMSFQQLKDARYILQGGASLADVGMLIHGLRRIVQHDGVREAEQAQRLLNRLMR